MAAAQIRGHLDLRPLSSEQGILTRVDGSGKFAFGPLVTIASVTGPAEVRIRDELTDRATLEVVVRPLSGVAGIPTKSLSASIHSLLSPVILLDAHPRTLIQLVIQTLAAPAAPSDFLTPSFSEDSGTEEEAKAGPSRVRALGPDRAAEAAEKAGAINAAMMALLDAGIPMRATVAACSCVVLRPKDANRLRPKNGAAGMRAGEPDMVEDVDMDGDDSQTKSTILLDPTPAEEAVALSSHIFAFSFSTATGQATSKAAEQEDGGQHELLYAESNGSVAFDDYSDALSLCRTGAKAIAAYMRKSVERRLQ